MNKEKDNNSFPWRFILPLLLSTMMNPLNSSMLSTALITLCNSFKVSLGQGAILVVSLYVTSTIAQPLMGRLADIYSAKKINTIGYLLVFTATLTGLFAANFHWLIASRILLGLGTSAAYPSAISLINRKYSEIDSTVPGNVLGAVAITSQVSVIIGPSLGGILTEWLSWRGIYLINIPWVLTGIILSRAIPNYSLKKSDDKINIVRKLDVVGIIFFSAFLLFLLLALLEIKISLFHIAGLIVFLALTIWWENKQQSPFIDVKLLRSNLALSLVYIRTLATNYILYMLLFAFPQWLQEVRNVSPAHTGLILLPMTAVAIIVGYLIAKVEKPVFQNVLGVIVMVLACSGLFLLNKEISIVLFIACTVVLGTADGTNMIANQSLLNTQAPSSQKGVSFGLYRTAGYIGAIAAGTQLKKLFNDGATQQSFHQIGYYTLAASFIIVLLLIPLIKTGKKHHYLLTQ